MMDRSRKYGVAAAGTMFAVLVVCAIGYLPALSVGQIPNVPRNSPAVFPPGRGAAASRAPRVAQGQATPPVKAPASKSPPAVADSTSAEREKLFVGWPAPKAAIVVSGMLEGHIEPCGCTGLTNQKGGLMRRHTLMKQIAADWKCPLVPIDVGQHINRTGRQSEIKFQRMVDAYRTMKYQAVALGPMDLRLSTGELYTAMVGDNGATPFVSANVGVFGFDVETVPPLRVVEAGGLKIGLTTILGDSHHKALASEELKFKPAAEALGVVMKELKAARCDVLVLLAHATMDETKALAARFPEFQIVVTSGGAHEPLRQPERTKSGAMLVEVGRKGIYAGVIGVYPTAKGPGFRYQLVPLDARFDDSPEMVEIMASYQDELRNAWDMGLAAYGIKPIDDTGRRQFVGSQKCGECHTKAYEKWKETPHSHATESLVHPPERSEIARHYDAECLSCHVTGWEPQRFTPYLSGYNGLEEDKTPQLVGSGCENCHGAGSKHVAAEEEGADEATLAKLRNEMVLAFDAAEQTCLKCHDLENSPDFHKKGAFEEYWKKVEHPGKD